MKKMIAVILVALMLFASAGVFATNSVIPDISVYSDSANRVNELGIINWTDSGAFKPEAVITRLQFAEMVIIAAGLQEEANAKKGATIFSDIASSGEKNGYVNAAIEEGFLTGLSDSKFHPDDAITFAQLCTSLVKALGYIDQDISGLWPKNYIDKAASLGLTEGINLGRNESVPMWAMAVIMDRLLDTSVKKAIPSDTDKTFSDAFGQYTEAIVLENINIDKSLGSNQVLTDKGIYYINNAVSKLELGKKYRLTLSGNRIVTIAGITKPTLDISVESVAGAYITYRQGVQAKSMTLPESAVYYYQGKIQAYAGIKNVIQPESSIVLAYNSGRMGYDYGVIYDPVYSKPEIATGFNTFNQKIGSIQLTSGIPILKNGQQIDVSQIEDKDIIYRVSDIWNLNNFIMVWDNKVEGVLKSVLPSKTAAKTIQIDTSTYEFSQYMNFGKLNNTGGSVDIDENVTVLLDCDGKVVDIIESNEDDTSNYAFVLNYSYPATSYGGTVYQVKLLLTDGTVQTYSTAADPVVKKGKLVTYALQSDGKVILSDVGYTSTSQLIISKDAGQINSTFVTDNVKILNLVANDVGTDASVNLLKWSDLPAGTFQGSKLLAVKYSGEFADASLILLNDIFDQNNRLAYVTHVGGAASTMLINGKPYNYSGGGLSEGTVVRVMLNGNGSVNSIVEVKIPQAVSTSVQAYDSKRIKINSSVYQLKNSLAVYFRDKSGNITLKSLEDIDTAKTYLQACTYAESDGKVEIIIIIE